MHLPGFYKLLKIAFIILTLDKLIPQRGTTSGSFSSNLTTVRNVLKTNSQAICWGNIENFLMSEKQRSFQTSQCKQTPLGKCPGDAYSPDVEPLMKPAALTFKTMSHHSHLEREINDFGHSRYHSRMRRYILKSNQNGVSSALPLRTSNPTDHVTYLIKLLLSMIKEELSRCELVIFYRQNHTSSEIIAKLALLPNGKQILQVENGGNFSSVNWVSSRCRGYIFLWPVVQIFGMFMDTELELWDYRGKYIFVGISLSDLKTIAESQKGRKTEHLVGLVKSGRNNVWWPYINQLFGEPKIVRVNKSLESHVDPYKTLFPDKTSNLRGITLKAVIFLWQPNVIYQENDAGNRVLPYGLDVEIMKTLSRVMNFSIYFMEPPKGERWGEFTPNGSLTGMLGMVHRGEADVGSANLFMSVTRVRHIDYTTAFDLERSCVLLHTEKPLPSWQALAFPYQPWMWFSILVTLLFVGPVLYHLAKASAKLGKEIKRFDSLSYCWYYIFSMYLNEPQDKMPRRIHTQIFIAFLWLYSMVITISYSTNLTAFLTVKKSPYGMETIAELPLSGMQVVGVDSYYQNMLKSSPDPNLQAMATTYQIFYDSQEVYSKVLSGEAVFIDSRGHMEYTILTKFTRRGSSPLRIMKECFASHPVAMALQDHSPLKKRIDQIISRLLYAGLVRKYFTEALRKAVAPKDFNEKESPQTEENEPPQTNDFSRDKIVPMSLDHMQGLFFIAVLGLSVSVVVFAIEKLNV